MPLHNDVIHGGQELFSLMMNNGSICGQLVMTFSLEHFSLGTASSSHETHSNVKSKSSTSTDWVREKRAACFTGSTVEGKKRKQKKSCLKYWCLHNHLFVTLPPPPSTSVFKSTSVHKIHWSPSEGKNNQPGRSWEEQKITGKESRWEEFIWGLKKAIAKKSRCF